MCTTEVFDVGERNKKEVAHLQNSICPLIKCGSKAGTHLAQWRHKIPIYYGWRWHGMLTTERQQYSENPGGAPRQCISVCPWKLAQPIAGYRRSTRFILNPQWHKRLHAAYFYFYLCWRSLQNTWFYFFVLRELDTWLDLLPKCYLFLHEGKWCGVCAASG